MSISNIGLASSAAIEARIKKAIAYTQSKNASFDESLSANQSRVDRSQAAKNASNSQKSQAISSAEKIPDDINWGEVSGNLGAANGNVIYTTDLARIADLALKDATAKLDKAFADAGISNDPSVNFTLSRYDGDLVVGDHPQKEKIEALFADNPQLKYDVREAFALKDQAVATQKGSIYADAYQRSYASKGKAAADALTDIFLSLPDSHPTYRYGAQGIKTFYNGQSDDTYLAYIAGRLGFNTGFVNVTA